MDTARLRTARLLVLIGGVCIATTGLLAGLAGIALSLASATAAPPVLPLTAASIAVLSVSLGSALAWQAWQSMQGRPSRPWLPRRIGIGLAAFAGALVLGTWASRRPPLDLIVLPWAHILATALPPLIILSLAARSLRGRARGRHLLLQLGSGAFVSTFLAMLAEVLLIGGLALAAAVAVAALPGGQERFQALAQRLQDPAFLQDPAQMVGLVRSPWVWGAALLLGSAAVPIVEESLKTAGVGLLLYRKPGREEAYLWGLASGAGFALTESMLNSVLGLASWGTAVLLRVPASLMHCCTGALMGLAWHAAWIERRRARGLGLFAASLALHGAWNALAVGMALLSMGESSASTPWTGAGWGPLAGLALLALALCVAFGLAWLTRHLRLTAAEITTSSLPSAAAGGTEGGYHRPPCAPGEGEALGSAAPDDPADPPEAGQV